MTKYAVVLSHNSVEVVKFFTDNNISVRYIRMICLVSWYTVRALEINLSDEDVVAYIIRFSGTPPLRNSDTYILFE